MSDPENNECVHEHCADSPVCLLDGKTTMAELPKHEWREIEDTLRKAVNSKRGAGIHPRGCAEILRRLANAERVREERDELRGYLQELRISYHASGRRPEECYEMSLIDEALRARKGGGDGAESMIMLALQSDGTIDQKDMADALRAATARVAELEERLPCGHRKTDWDDGYGGCSFCSIKRIHDAHE